MAESILNLWIDLGFFGAIILFKDVKGRILKKIVRDSEQAQKGITYKFMNIPVLGRG